MSVPDSAPTARNHALSFSDLEICPVDILGIITSFLTGYEILALFRTYSRLLTSKLTSSGGVKILIISPKHNNPDTVEALGSLYRFVSLEELVIHHPRSRIWTTGPSLLAQMPKTLRKLVLTMPVTLSQWMEGIISPMLSSATDAGMLQTHQPKGRRNKTHASPAPKKPQVASTSKQIAPLSELFPNLVEFKISGGVHYRTSGQAHFSRIPFLQSFPQTLRRLSLPSLGSYSDGILKAIEFSALTHLELIHHSETLPECAWDHFPNTLTELDLDTSYCVFPTTSTFSKLPPDLTSFTWRTGGGTREHLDMIQLFEGLAEHSNLTKVNFALSMTEFSHYEQLYSTLPRRLTECRLHLNDVTGYLVPYDFGNLPRTLKVFQLVSNRIIMFLPDWSNLPPSIQELGLVQNVAIPEAQFGTLPYGLTSLTLSLARGAFKNHTCGDVMCGRDCLGYESHPELSHQITDEVVELLPSSLTKLCIVHSCFGGPFLSKLRLPSLTHLEFLTHLPIDQWTFPDLPSLKYLDLCDRVNFRLDHLVQLPPSLTYLSACAAPDIVSYQYNESLLLPPDLVHLALAGFYSFSAGFLKILPIGLKHLALPGLNEYPVTSLHLLPRYLEDFKVGKVVVEAADRQQFKSLISELPRGVKAAALAYCTGGGKTLRFVDLMR